MVEPSDTEVVEWLKRWGEAAGVIADHCDGRSPWAFCDDHNTYAGFGGSDDRFHVWHERTVATEGSREVDVDTLLIWALAVISGATAGRERREAASVVLDADPISREQIAVACDEWESAGDPLGPAIANWLRQFDPVVGRIDGWRGAALAGVRTAWERLTIACPRCRDVETVVGRDCSVCEGNGRLAESLVLRRFIVSLYTDQPADAQNMGAFTQTWSLVRDPEFGTIEFGEIATYTWRSAGPETWEIVATVSSRAGQPDIGIEHTTIRRM